MNKLNKKGFTLIEMLVVIAIIAVLVAIIIPTISSATDKAAAAANAANLRSWKAELTTGYLSGTVTKGTAANGKTPVDTSKATEIKTPVFKKLSFLQSATADAYFDGEEIICTFGKGKDIKYFATIAETGKAPAESKVVGYDNEGNPLLGA